jgi:hypothetical protein
MKDSRKRSRKRQRDRLVELATTKEHVAENDPNFNGDWRTLSHQLFSKNARAFLDLSLGPIVFFPKCPPRQRKLLLASQNFPIAWSEKGTEKNKIAECLLNTIEETGDFLLPRGAKVLLGLGSTVFHVALVLATWLRDTIEEFHGAQNPQIARKTNFSDGQWHTDCFEFARLLGPLASPPWAPSVYLCGCEVSRKGFNIPDHRLNIPLDRSQLANSKRTIDVLIMGCMGVDDNGVIYVGNANDKDVVEQHVAEPRERIFVVATSDKIGRQFNEIHRMKFDRGDRRFYLVTDARPKNLKAPPDGFAELHWPGGRIT